MDYRATTPYADTVTHAAAARLSGISAELKSEIVRKSLHMLIALVPSLASVVGIVPTLAILSGGVLFYSGAEFLRIRGHSVAGISRITVIASRPRDRGHFVIGPVTLGVGAMLAILLYPAPAAFLAIYALAFGDGLASLIGRVFGRIRFLGGKSVEGSLACFVAVFASSLAVTEDVTVSLIIAVAATGLEVLPTSDLDNLVLPIGIGLLATLLL